MKHFFQLLMFFVLTSSGTFAQSNSEADVAKAMERLNAAILSGDAQKLLSLIHI